VRNVATLVTAPKGTEGRPSKALTMGQADALLTTASRSRLHAYIVVSLLTGIRTEEARALTWDRVHPEQVGAMPPHVEVWCSVRAHGDTKTKKSRRTLALPPQAVTALRAHKAQQARDRLAAGELWQETGLVFTTTVGTALDAANVRRGFRTIITAAGIGTQRLMVLACDAAVGATSRVRPVQDVQLVGGGGTDMRVGIAAAEASRPRPDVIVVFTDGYTPWPDRPTRARLVVAIIGFQSSIEHAPDWATTVRVTAA